MLGSPPLFRVFPLGAGLAICNILRFGRKGTLYTDFVLAV